MKKNYKLSSLITSCVIVIFFQSCATLQQVRDTMVNLQRLQFKLANISPGTLAGVNLAKVNTPSALNFQDGLKLAAAFAQKSLPVAFYIKRGS